MWLTPLWLLAMLPAAERWAEHRGGRAVALLLAALSVLSANTSPRDPWRHPWLFRLFR